MTDSTGPPEHPSENSGVAQAGNRVLLRDSRRPAGEGGPFRAHWFTALRVLNAKAAGSMRWQGHEKRCDVATQVKGRAAS